MTRRADRGRGFRAAGAWCGRGRALALAFARAFARAFALVLAAAACGEDGVASPGHGAAPAAGRATSTSLLARLDRAFVVRRSAPEGEPLAATAHMQPWTEDELLWFAPPAGGAPVRLPDVAFQQGAALELGMGLLPDSPPVPPGAGGRFRFQLLLRRDGERLTLLEHLLPLDGLVPGETVSQRVELPGPAGAGELVLRVMNEGAPSKLVPAWRDLRLVQVRAPERERVLRVVSSTPLADLRAPDDPGTTERVEPILASFGFEPHPGGRVLRQALPGDAVFLVDRTREARLSLRVVEDSQPQRAQGKLRFEVWVDGEQALATTLTGYPPTPSHVVQVPLGPPQAEPARVELRSAWVDPDAAAGDDTAPSMRALWIHPRVEVLEELPRQRQGQGPNVLLVVVDTLRADHLELYGYERATAPQLSARAAEGVVFERALAPSSWTVPSMASLFTGHYAYTHGLYDETHWVLDPDMPTLAEAFREAGLSTVCVMSNPLLDRYNGALRGFEQVESVPLASAAQVNRAFRDWLDGHGDERFFATVHYFDPHDPYGAPGAALDRFLPPGRQGRSDNTLFKQVQRPVRHQLRNLPEGTLLADLTEKNQKHVDRLVDLYDGEIAYWDGHFAALMDDLEARGLADDTLVLITADHGESFVEHGMLGHGRDLHDELVRVPLVLLNSGAPAGRRPGMVGLVDVAPTLLRLAGVAPSGRGGPPFVGRDLLQPGPPREFLFAQTSHGERVMDGDKLEYQAVMTPGGKAVRVEGVDGLLLYDLADDPHEQHPRAVEGSLAERLHQALDDWEAASRALSSWQGEGAGLDPEVEAAMRALGYLK